MPTRIILPKSEKPEKKRTAAYCRVSSSSEEQLHSYAAQVKFYTEMLSADKSCEFVGVYADASDIIGLNQNPNKTGVDLVLFFSFPAQYKRRVV